MIMACGGQDFVLGKYDIYTPVNNVLTNIQHALIPLHVTNIFVCQTHSDFRWDGWGIDFVQF